MHEQRDHRCRPGRVMRNAGQQIERKILTRLGDGLGQQSLVAQQRTQRKCPDAKTGVLKKLPTRLRPGLETRHGRNHVISRHRETRWN